MAGDPQNASLWADADVYVGTLEATMPDDVDTDFGAGWELVGLLDGDAGFGTTRNEDTADHNAWGGILVRTSRRNFKMERTFTLLEDNEVTRQLIWPGSTATKLFVPRPQPIKLAFELREGAKVSRLVTANRAEVTVDGDITENEADLTRYPMRAVIYPDTTDVSALGGALLFHRQVGELSGD